MNASKIIDFHSHVLPGIDDGSSSVEESIAMLRMEAEQGIRHVVATPHFYPQRDTPARFLRRRAEAEARLREEMEKHPGLPSLSIGAEVYFFSGISNSDALRELTIDGTEYVLLEMPESPWSDRLYREMRDIRDKQGIIPVVAHVDRYIGPFRTYDIPERLEELPVLVQANAGFFLRRPTRKMALRMLRRGQIHLLGSDCHNRTGRIPNLGTAAELIEKHLGESYLDRIAACQSEILGI